MSETPPDFVHLHVHTQYSLLDGAIRIDAALKRAAQFGMTSLAITDHGTMFGTLEFHEKATKAGIKPIIGCECYLAPRRLTDKTPLDHQMGTAHLVLLAETQQGYQNLCRLASIAQLEGFYYRPRIDKELLEANCSGLIGLSACLHGEIPQLIKQGKMAEAADAARWYQSLFGENSFFLEAQYNGIPEQDIVNQGLLELSSRLSIPMVATNDCHYLDKSDVHAHEVLLCIQTGKTIKDTDRFQFKTDQLYFKSGEEMRATLGHFPDAIANTQVIADRCHVEFDFKTFHFPKFESGSGRSAEDIFDETVEAGFKVVMERIRGKNPGVDEAVYRERLDYEKSVIKKMGFSGYFLIVADFIRYGKENGVPVGPGRGSAAGSLVAYAMKITDLDPLEHGLIFERFLNPARASMPDIDVDFCINGREKVFKYVVERYGGGDFVAQIITFGKLKTRAVIRDVGRALDIPLKEVDAIAKMVPDVLNISLEAALKEEPRLLEMAGERPDIRELIQICQVLEGLPRHASTHAAGVVIGDKPLVEYLPLYKGKKGEVVTQFDMKRVEQIGLVKFDFLGLRNLTVIDRALSLIAEQGVTPPDLSNLDFDDADTYKLLSSGDTTGVFQLESSGMKDLLVRLKPACFADVVALVALYRPGPLESGMVDDFVERKHGRKAVEYLVPQLASVLKETYGVIVYQEQVMKIAGDLANYSMAEADGLRKAMGKKIPEIMAQHRERFLKGASENNIPKDRAAQLFDLMEKFGGYGFNKSHSAAYALIAFQTAFLKAHFPVEFMAALLTSEMQNSEAVVKFITECRKHDIPILPPDINASAIEFTVRNKEIRFGLVAVKNVGEGAIESILEARKKGSGEGKRFNSLFEFCERVDLRKVNKRVLESLIKCGAFDSIGARRSQLMAALEDALDYGQRVQKERSNKQMGLFKMGPKNAIPINLPPIPNLTEWDDKQRLAYEKEVLGFYVSGHPLSRFETVIEKFANADALSANDLPDGVAVRMGGLISSVKNIKTKKGELMAFVSLEDLLGTVEVVVFSSIYAQVADILTEDNAILVQGQLQKDENSIKIKADAIVPMDKAEETWTATVCIRLDNARTEKEQLVKLRDIFARHSGTCGVIVDVIDREKSEVRIELPHPFRLKAGEGLKREIDGLFGYDVVSTVCMAATLAPSQGKGNGWQSYKKK
ncbi:MAG: DNA polymerase III subunit alpha [Pseudomonadota bacterium]